MIASAPMRHLLLGVAVAFSVAIVGTVQAQPPFLGSGQGSPVTYPDPYSYRFVAPTPEDAYRQGLINRWELEQLEGPTPQALQGPSPNGDKSQPGR